VFQLWICRADGELSNLKGGYRTVNYLAYRVSVSNSAAMQWARKARSLAEAAAKLEILGGPDHYDLLVPELEAQASRAEAAAARAQAALNSCWAMAQVNGRGGTVRVSDGASLSWEESDGMRAAVGKCYAEATAGRGEAHVAFEIVKALHALVRDLGVRRTRSM
jgi:hypothetical protein